MIEHNANELCQLVADHLSRCPVEFLERLRADDDPQIDRLSEHLLECHPCGAALDGVVARLPASDGARVALLDDPEPTFVDFFVATEVFARLERDPVPTRGARALTPFERIVRRVTVAVWLHTPWSEVVGPLSVSVRVVDRLKGEVLGDDGELRFSEDECVRRGRTLVDEEVARVLEQTDERTEGDLRQLVKVYCSDRLLQSCHGDRERNLARRIMRFVEDAHEVSNATWGAVLRRCGPGESTADWVRRFWVRVTNGFCEFLNQHGLRCAD